MRGGGGGEGVRINGSWTVGTGQQFIDAGGGGGGGSMEGGLTPVDRITHNSENITSPRTSSVKTGPIWRHS